MPLQSAIGQFENDPNVTLWPVTTGDESHTGLVSNLAVQGRILSKLGFPLPESQLSNSFFKIHPLNCLSVISDPVETILTDGNGKRLGYTQATGVLTEIPNSVWFGDSDGMGWVFGSVAAPLNLQLGGLGDNYYVQVSGVQDGLEFGLDSSGFLDVGSPRNLLVIDHINHRPELDAIPDRSLEPGTIIVFQSHATDFDIQDQLIFSLDPGAPTGAGIDPTTGAFTWTPMTAQSPGSYDLTVRVTDNGQPPQVAAQTFQVTLAPHISITDVTARETDAATTWFDFTVTMSSAVGQPVTVDYATVDGTASLADDDFQFKSGTLTFAPGGPLTQIIRVLVTGDRKAESNEAFFVNLSSVAGVVLDKSQGLGTILNDDTTISIEDVTQNERAAGPTSFDFSVRLSYSSALPVSVDYTTADGTATRADGDYEALSGTLTFNPGETTKTITVVVNGDLKSETDEIFFVKLANPVNGTLVAGGQLARGVILDDDTGGTNYYVNDSSTVGDVFTTAPGNNANDGKSPATPLASLPGLLTLYTFHPGDTIYVDTGAYALVRNVTLGPQHSGVRIVGPGPCQVTPSLSADVVLADQPVAFWRLGDAGGPTAVDATGHGYDGTYIGGVKPDPAAPSDDGAALFDGKGGYVTVPNPPALNPKQFTIEAWFKGSVNATNSTQAVLKMGNYFIAYTPIYSSSAFMLAFGYFDYYGRTYLASATPAMGGWTHVVATLDGSNTGRLYLNGDCAPATPKSVCLSTASGLPLRSRALGNSNEGTWKGDIDEVAVYDKVLTQDQIQAHYAQAGFTGAILDRGNLSEGSYGIQLAGAVNVGVSGLSVTGESRRYLRRSWCRQSRPHGI